MESEDITSAKESFLNRWFVVWLLCVIIGFFWGLFFSFHVTFSITTVYWVSSTIVQGFGAMIAIVIAMSIYHRGRWTEQYKEFCDKRDEDLSSLTEDFPEKHKEIYVKIMMDWNTVKLNLLQDHLFFRFKNNPFFQSTFLLIGMAIFIMIWAPIIEDMFRVAIANFWIAWVLWYLAIHSFYCLVLLSNRIYEIL